MQKNLHVISHELLTALRRPSFLFFAFGIPLIIILVFSGIRLFRATTGSGEAPITNPENENQLKVEGFIDQAGIITVIPPDLPAGILQRYENEEQAKEALKKGEITAYYLIPAAYVEDGALINARPGFSLLAPGGQDWVMRWTLIYNLVGGDLQIATRILIPTNTKYIDLSTASTPGADQPGCQTGGYDCEEILFLRYLPMIFLIVFFMSILMAASLLIYSISLEKDNRVMEVLLVSVSPRQLLTGKITGLGILGLIQITVYLATILLVSIIGGQTLQLPENFTFPYAYIAWGLVFFILGYTLYASLMAGAGALVPDMKSYSGTSMLIASPLFFGYMASIILGFDPNGTIATFLSLFPLTSPVVMMWRMVNSNIPFWQPALASILLILTSWFTVQTVAKMFSARELLSGQPFQLKVFLSKMFGR